MLCNIEMADTDGFWIGLRHHHDTDTGNLCVKWQIQLVKVAGFQDLRDIKSVFDAYLGCKVHGIGALSLPYLIPEWTMAWNHEKPRSLYHANSSERPWSGFKTVQLKMLNRIIFSNWDQPDKRQPRVTPEVCHSRSAFGSGILSAFQPK